MDKQSFIEKSNEIHSCTYSYEYVNYVNKKIPVDIKCSKHGIFSQKPKYHLSGSGCPSCAQEIRANSNKLSLQDFISLSNVKHGNKYDYSNVNYKSNKTKVKIICPEHGEFKQTPSHHMNGRGCHKCGGSYSMTNTEFINKCKKIHESYYDYSNVNFQNLKGSIIIICPEHGDFKQRAGHHIKGHGCKKCKMSNGERKIYNFLTKENINFQYQKKFDKCKDKRKLPFDFYLPEYNILIEFDGRQHFENIDVFGNNLKLIQKRDRIKNAFAKDNNYKLIRLNNKSDINKIIKKAMNN